MPNKRRRVPGRLSLCPYCKKPGHESRDCWYNPRSTVPECEYCHLKNHKTEDCLHKPEREMSSWHHSTSRQKSPRDYDSEKDLESRHKSSKERSEPGSATSVKSRLGRKLGEERLDRESEMIGELISKQRKDTEDIEKETRRHQPTSRRESPRDDDLGKGSESRRLPVKERLGPSSATSAKSRLGPKIGEEQLDRESEMIGELISKQRRNTEDIEKENRLYAKENTYEGEVAYDDDVDSFLYMKSKDRRYRMDSPHTRREDGERLYRMDSPRTWKEDGELRRLRESIRNYDDEQLYREEQRSVEVLRYHDERRLHRRSRSMSPRRYHNPRERSPRIKSPRGPSPRGRSPRKLSPRRSPRGYSPRGRSPRGYSPRGRSPRGYSPRARSPRGYSPKGRSPRGYSARERSPRGYSPRGRSPRHHLTRRSSRGHSPRRESPKGRSPRRRSYDRSIFHRSPRSRSPRGRSSRGESPRGRNSRDRSPRGKTSNDRSPRRRSPRDKSPRQKSPLSKRRRSRSPIRVPDSKNATPVAAIIPMYPQKDAPPTNPTKYTAPTQVPAAPQPPNKEAAEKTTFKALTEEKKKELELKRDVYSKKIETLNEDLQQLEIRRLSMQNSSKEPKKSLVDENFHLQDAVKKQVEQLKILLQRIDLLLGLPEEKKELVPPGTEMTPPSTGVQPSTFMQPPNVVQPQTVVQPPTAIQPSTIVWPPIAVQSPNAIATSTVQSVTTQPPTATSIVQSMDIKSQLPIYHILPSPTSVAPTTAHYTPYGVQPPGIQLATPQAFVPQQPNITQMEKVPKEEPVELNKEIVGARKEDTVVKQHTDEDDVSYECYESQCYWCDTCDVFPEKVQQYLQHLSSAQHKRQNDELENERPWVKKKINYLLKQKKKGRLVRIPYQGAQFLVPVNGYYCKLCEEVIEDFSLAIAHFESIGHNKKYKEFTADHPSYEVDWVIRRKDAEKRATETKLKRKREKKEVKTPEELTQYLLKQRGDELIQKLDTIRKKKENDCSSSEGAKSGKAEAGVVDLNDCGKVSDAPSWQDKRKIKVNLKSTRFMGDTKVATRKPERSVVIDDNNDDDEELFENQSGATGSMMDAEELMVLKSKIKKLKETQKRSGDNVLRLSALSKIGALDQHGETSGSENTVSLSEIPVLKEPRRPEKPTAYSDVTETPLTSKDGHRSHSTSEEGKKSHAQRKGFGRNWNEDLLLLGISPDDSAIGPKIQPPPMLKK